MNNDPLIANKILQILIRVYMITSFATSYGSISNESECSEQKQVEEEHTRFNSLYGKQTQFCTRT